MLYLNWFIWVGTLLIVCTSTAVVFGWLLHIQLLKSVLPGLATMKVNTAFGLLAASSALLLLHTSGSKPRSIRLARVLSIFVAALGGLTLVEGFLELDFGIDELIASDDPQPIATSYPGRMSPATALNFFVVAFALFVLKARQPRLAACAHWVLIFPLFVSALAIVGYAYGVNSLYHVGFSTSTALHTALSFFILSLCLLAADSNHGFARIAASETAGGLVSRLLLPTIPVILFFLGWARLEGERAGLYDTNFGLALMVLISTTVCIVAVAWIAIRLDKIDVRRQQGEFEIVKLNQGLEHRVKDRTQQLSQLSEKLSAANIALERLSLQDALTGIANRRSFDAYIESQIAVAHRYKRPLALVLCDVDSFKSYNDHYGHQAGDECLKQIAVAIQSCCRRPADMAARYGGEEFALILPDTDLIGATEVAEAVKGAVARLEHPHEYSLVAPFISVSGGLAVLLRDDDTAEKLIAAADQHLYEAKSLGRNRMIPMRA